MGTSSKDLVDNKLRNPVYSRILFELYVEDLHLYELTKRLKKAKSVVLKQLRGLVADRILTVRTEGRRKTYALNWTTVTLKFIEFINTKTPDAKMSTAFKNDKNLQNFQKELVTQALDEEDEPMENLTFEELWDFFFRSMLTYPQMWRNEKKQTRPVAQLNKVMEAVLAEEAKKEKRLHRLAKRMNSAF